MAQFKQRSYEVSIWTLQDEFISVLKAPNIEYKGQGIDPIVTLKDDGTEEYTFNIPMYVIEDGIRIDNPLWITFSDITVIENTRKIKVILNKGVKDVEKVYEFLITKIEEEHKEDSSIYKVSCEGLPFHELGKKGYTISLTQEDFENDDYEWFTKGYWIDSFGNARADQPKQTLKYWNDKVFAAYPDWKYKIQMNWGEYPSRLSNKVYENEHLNWSVDNSGNYSFDVIGEKEKERPLNLNNSNIYNLTQDMAKTFGVFCRYEYEYDINYHIIGKNVIYYNSYSKESFGYLDITYPYNTDNLVRTKDSSDIITKMYVRSIEDSSSESGYLTIMDVAANKSGEDYILNFDYLHEVGTINDEQYAEVNNFEAQMGVLNRQLINLSNRIIWYENELPELEAKKTVLTNSLITAQEQFNKNNDLYNSLIGDEGIITLTSNNPASYLLRWNINEQIYYLNITNQGVIYDNTLQFYSAYNSVNHILSAPINQFTVVRDEFNNITQVKFPGLAKSANSKIIYAIYKYSPQLYYDNIRNGWYKKIAIDKAKLEGLYKEEDGIITGTIPTTEATLLNLKEQYKEKLKEKKNLIISFDKMMGPALREGYWQPENYTDYGTSHEVELSLNPLMVSTTPLDEARVIWDIQKFEGEQEITYPVIDFTQSDPVIGNESYLCIDLSSIWGKISNYVGKRLSLIFSENANNNNAIRSYVENSEMIYGFITYRDNSVIKEVPALILLNSDKLSSIELNLLKNTCYLGLMEAEVINGVVEMNTTTIVTHDELADKFVDNALAMVYPRVKIASNALKNSSDELIIKYNDQILTNFEHYSVLQRDDGYYITIHPDIILSTYGYQKVVVDYKISNANLSIYMDALKIAEENAKPKVSYTINVNTYANTEYNYLLYEHLGRVVNINDENLKFRDVRGYISEVELHLAAPWDDKIVVKNYTNKFEDLFSTIVAQTEEMHKNSPLMEVFGGTVNPDGTISDDSFMHTLENNQRILNAYLDAGFDGSDVVESKLKELFDEAGEILNDAGSSLEAVKTLGTTNAAILASFAENVRMGLAPTNYKGARPTIFKPGDTWTDTEGNTYIAMFNSQSPSVSANGGWNKVYDGSIANIIGASFDMDADSGNINIKASSKLELVSADLQITGNNSVNIGGATVNIAGTNGLNFIDSSNSIAQMHIDGDTGIQMHGKAIEMTAATTENDNIAGITLNPDNGIWLGANQPITLYSGNYDDDPKNAVVTISKDKILYGVNSEDSGTATEMTKDYIVLATGKYTKEDNIPNVTGTSQGLVGAKLTQNSIGFATQSGTGNSAIINAILMNDNGITIGSGTVGNPLDVTASTVTLRNKVDGAYVRVASSGIDLGTTANLYINANNFKLQTNAGAKDEDNQDSIGDTIFVIGTKLNNITSNTNPSTLGQDSNINFLVNKEGAFVKGTVYATSGSFTGAVHATSFELTGNATINYNQITGLNQQVVDKVNEITTSATTIVNETNTYARTSNATQPADSAFMDNIPDSSAGIYLWTKHVTTYQNGASAITYYCSKDGAVGQPGAAGKSISKITVLYYLNTATTAPNPPTASTIYATNVINKWTIMCPTWTNESKAYYRSYKYEFSDGTVTYGDVAIDYGMTAANQNATAASKEAQDLVTTLQSNFQGFTVNGLTQYLTLGNNTTDTYDVALTSTRGLLIGANSKVAIATSGTASSTAIVLYKGGIALNGQTISIKSSTSDTTNVMSLNSNGITINSNKSIKLAATNSLIIQSGNFQIDASGNVKIAGNEGTTCKIGGWKVSGNMLYNEGAVQSVTDPTTNEVTNTYPGYIGLDAGSTSSNPNMIAIWAGAETKNNALFKVTRGGELTATKGTIGGWIIGTSTSPNILYSKLDNNESSYVFLNAAEPGSGYTNSTEYCFWAGKNYDHRASAPIRITRGGSITATTGNIGGWTMANNMLEVGSGTVAAGMSANKTKNEATNKAYSLTIPKGDKSGDPQEGFYAFWAGNTDPDKAPFRVTHDGRVFIEKLISATPQEGNTYIYNTYNISNTSNGSGGSTGGSGGSGGGSPVDFNPTEHMDLLVGEWTKQQTSASYTTTMEYNNTEIDSITTTIALASTTTAPVTGNQIPYTNVSDNVYLKVTSGSNTLLAYEIRASKPILYTTNSLPNGVSIASGAVVPSAKYVYARVGSSGKYCETAIKLPEGTLSITSNGTHNVRNYASVDVNVSTSASVSGGSFGTAATPSAVSTSCSSVSSSNLTAGRYVTFSLQIDGVTHRYHASIT